MKRLFDILFAITALLITLPLLIAITGLIALSSKGPVLFRQQRVGRYGKLFILYKFRTMVSVPLMVHNPGVSIKNDPRETRVGHYLRASKMDELPQLWNVLIGDMSVVGPRPEIPAIVQQYTEEQHGVLEVRPGMVGLAQIIGCREADMFPPSLEDAEKFYVQYILPDKLKIDLQYIQNQGFWNDLIILFRALLEVVVRFIQPLSQSRRTVWSNLFLFDLFLIVFSYLLAYGVRFDWAIAEAERMIFWHSLPIVILVRVVVFQYFKLYRCYCKYIGIRELIQMVKACSASSALIVMVVFFIGVRVHSRSIFLIDWTFLVLGMAGIRVYMRLLSERTAPISYADVKNVLVIGAGDIGEMLVREQSKNGNPYRVVGFIDDNRDKIGTLIHGVKVYGDRNDVPQVARMLRADEIVIAISNITPSELKNIISFCEKTRLKHRIVPAITDVVSGRMKVTRLREVDLTDFLSRTPLQLNFEAIQRFVMGRRVLITGAGGSIGSELAREVASYHPQELVLLDRNENYLFELQSELLDMTGQTQARMKFIIADITNRSKMERLFQQILPEIVFHAAAQKHVPLSEYNPDEAVCVNINGTRLLARLADRYGTGHFVFISTDKAVNPTSVMGVTKRVAELLLQSLAQNSLTHFITVRFGNVLNSHGSVVPLFCKQICNGGPVTVTHSDVERFFMSIPEAVNLILQAVTMGQNGDIYILDMGKSIKIEKLAIEMIKLAGYTPMADIKIRHTGLRPGEKLYEELVGVEEISHTTAHEMIRRIIPQNGLPHRFVEKGIDELMELIHTDDKGFSLRNKLKQIVPEYVSGFEELTPPTSATCAEFKRAAIDTELGEFPEAERLLHAVENWKDSLE